MKASLVVAIGKSQGQEIQLKTTKFAIGRDPRCHLRPNSELVSKLHCCFEYTANGFTLRDLGSTNGTFVNNQKINETVLLSDGDLIKVGALVFAFKCSIPPAAKAAPSAEDDLLSWISDGPDAAPSANDSTIMDMKLPAEVAEQETVVDTKLTPETTQPPATPPKKDTRDAASEILNRMLVRRRST